MSSIAVEVDKVSGGEHRHKRLARWVEDVAIAHQARKCVLVRRISS